MPSKLPKCLLATLWVDCFRLLQELPAGQRKVCQALIAGGGQTYGAVSRALSISRGTTSRHLRQVRIQRPEIYAAIMAVRAQQLSDRHKRALARAADHNWAWHKSVARRRWLQGATESERPLGRFGTIVD
jgi:hypothetical protein